MHSPAEPPYVLAIDIGTSSVRSLLFNRSGEPLNDTLATRENSILISAEGLVEANPDRLLDQVWGCIDATLLLSVPHSRRIIGVATCTFAGSTLGLDATYRPLTPLVLYSDTRAEEDVPVLRERLDEAASHQRTGVRFHSAYQPARLLWYARTQPALFARVKHWVTLGEYMVFRLFGELAVSTSIASWVGILNIHTYEWDRELLEILPIQREALSPLIDMHDGMVGLRKEFAARWPVLERVPWFPAVGDGASANLGSGCTSSRQVSITIGTTSAVRSVLEGQIPPIPVGLWCYRVDSRRAIMGGALTEGGSVFAWLVSLMQLQAGPDLEAALGRLPPDGHGLTFLPLISGERSPGWKGDARGAVTGLSLSTTSLELLLASLEGVAYRVAQVYDLLRPALPGDPEIIASGRALLNSPLWMHILADGLGVPLIESGAEQASARGAALLALEALQQIDDIRNVPGFLGASYSPNMQHHAIYLAAMLRQQDLYRRLGF